MTGVPADKQVGGKGLIYNTPITYEENLAYIAKSKCILEILQKNAEGYSLRLWEAITYDKHLLTNNTYVCGSQYWTSGGIHLLSDNLELTFINSPITYPDYMKESTSPINMLYFIEKLC